jgi:hypothetical protein
MGMRLGTWIVRSLNMAGSLKTVSRELARYKLDLVGVQEVRWESGGTEPAGEYQDVVGWIILGWILERWDGVLWTGLVWLRIGTGGELL